MSLKPQRVPAHHPSATAQPAPSLGRTLFTLTWPMIFGVVALMGYQLVDSVYISMLGTEPLAALGFTVAVNQIFIGVQVGLGIAATALISRAIGAGESRRARHLGGLVLVAGSIIMAVLCVVAWLTRNAILLLLDADPALWPVIGQYWFPWLVSIWVGATLYLAYSISRAQGNTRLPGMVMVLTSLLNLAFDPLFIFVFDWGLPGAAWASVASFAIGGIIMWRRLLRYRWVRYSLNSMPILPAMRDLGSISGPAMLSQLMPGIAAMAATTIVAGFGAPAVAAWALSSRLEFFSIVVVLALTMSLPPMVGRYVGSRDFDEVDKLVRLAVRFVLLLQLCVAIVWLALSWILPTALSDDSQVSHFLRTWFVLVPISYGALGTCMIMVSVANAMSMPLRAVAISVLRLFACYLPALWAGSVVAGMTGVFAGVLLGNIAAGIVAWFMYKHAMQRISRGSAAITAPGKP